MQNWWRLAKRETENVFDNAIIMWRSESDFWKIPRMDRKHLRSILSVLRNSLHITLRVAPNTCATETSTISIPLGCGSSLV